MGSEDRAELMSDRLGMSKTVKKFLKFLLGKCGNCPFRITCWSRLFNVSDLIYEYREVFYCDGHYYGKAQETFDGKQVVKLIKNCCKCYYIEHCICNILESEEFLGMIEATNDEPMDHVKAINRCSECPDAVRCWSGRLKKMGFGWASSGTKIVRIMLECKFKKKGDD